MPAACSAAVPAAVLVLWAALASVQHRLNACHSFNSWYQLMRMSTRRQCASCRGNVVDTCGGYATLYIRINDTSGAQMWAGMRLDCLLVMVQTKLSRAAFEIWSQSSCSPRKAPEHLCCPAPHGNCGLFVHASCSHTQQTQQPL